MGRSPFGEGDGGVAGEALVEADGDKQPAEEGGDTGSDRGEKEDGEEQGEHTGEEVGEGDEGSVSGLAESEFDLLPHGVVLLRC
jgi:hypothetical protein